MGPAEIVHRPEEIAGLLQIHNILREVLSDPLEPGHAVPYRKVHAFHGRCVEPSLRNHARNDLVFDLFKSSPISSLHNLTVIETIGVSELPYGRAPAPPVWFDTPFTETFQERFRVYPVTVGHVDRSERISELGDHLIDEGMADLLSAFIGMHPDEVLTGGINACPDPQSLGSELLSAKS